MAGSADRSSRRYALSLAHSGCGRRLDQDLTRQAENYHHAYAAVRLIDDAVKDWLMNKGVTSIQLVPYLNFSRRVAKLRRRYHEETLKNEATYAVTEWSALGLRPELLTAMCRDVFDIDLTPRAAP